jgi:hypothetical protein
VESRIGSALSRQGTGPGELPVPLLPAGLSIAAPASRPAALPGIGSLSFNDVLNTIGTPVRA